MHLEVEAEPSFHHHTISTTYPICYRTMPFDCGRGPGGQTVTGRRSSHSDPITSTYLVAQHLLVEGGSHLPTAVRSRNSHQVYNLEVGLLDG
jgi:hypothetical protein